MSRLASIEETLRSARGRTLLRRLAVVSLVGALAAFWLARGAKSRRSTGPDPALSDRATGPLSVAASVHRIPGLSVAARVDLRTHRAARATIHYGPDSSYGLSTPELTVPESGTLSTTVIGLRPAAVTHLEVIVRTADGKRATSGDLTLLTDPLPTGVPSSLDVTLNRATTRDYVLLTVNHLTVNRGFAAMVDRTGRVLWYRAAEHRLSVFERLANGHFILHSLDPGDFEELDLGGKLVRKWRDPESTAETDGHDFKLLPSGHALMIGQEIRTVDSRRLLPGGAQRALRFDQTVTEVAPDGRAVWRWSTFAHVSESEITADPSTPLNPKDYEIAHMNSIEPLPDGDFLLSLRDMSSVVKLDRKRGAIAWRLGGKKSSFRFVNDPLGGFSRQHDARRLQNGNILLFDNGNGHKPPESRPVEYRLDEAAKTATLVWQHRRSPRLHAAVAGSTRRLPNGNTLSSYGPTGAVVEVDAASRPVWELRAPGGSFRATVAPTLYPDR